MLISVLRDAFKKKKRIEPQAQQAVDMERIRLVEAKANSGDLPGAELICLGLRADYPSDEGLVDLQYNIHRAMAEQRFPGAQYEQWLAWFHQHVNPQNYLEIGVANGKSMQCAKPPTRAIGVDPAIAVTFAPQTWVKLFKLPSDEFFAQHTPSDVFGGGAIDLAFIDGLHTFDQTLRDFVNVERHAASGSVVLIHDIFPVAEACAARERDTTIWLGDTWKMMILLRKYRPDLHIFTIPTYPSGLAVVGKLNPQDQTLQNNLERFCLEAHAYDFREYVPTIEQHLNAVPNDFATVYSQLENVGIRLEPIAG